MRCEKQGPRLGTVACVAVKDPMNSDSLGESDGEPADEPLVAADDLTWVVPLTPTSDDEMAAMGATRVRTLVQLRRELPLPAGIVESVPRITTRAFVPASDSERFLEVNNAAFDWHPDQGNWDEAKLTQVLAESWVELDGFLIHTGAGTGDIDGFCWTRIHPAELDTCDSGSAEPRLGEISAIGSLPATHGTGLGSALVVAGLIHLSSQDIEHAILYTEDSNTPALKMYERLGFRVTQLRGGYL